jgi:hypothetical protein
MLLSPLLRERRIKKTQKKKKNDEAYLFFCLFVCLFVCFLVFFFFWFFFFFFFLGLIGLILQWAYYIMALF